MGFLAVEMTPMAAVRALRALSGAIRGVLGWGFWLVPSETKNSQEPETSPKNVADWDALKQTKTESLWTGGVWKHQEVRFMGCAG